MNIKQIKTRLEELRAVLRSESISYGELAELQDLKDYIDPSDPELLEAAGVPEEEYRAMNRVRNFEVRTGKNKGFYIVSTYNKESDNYKRLAQTYGIINPEYNSGFYRYHNIKIGAELVWTHPRFAGHEFNRKVFKKLLKELS